MSYIEKTLPLLFNFELGNEGIKSFNEVGLKLIKEDVNVFNFLSPEEKIKNEYIWSAIGKLLVSEEFTK